ncbi:MAG: class I SAM-dependent methyltransferase [Clostridiales bacterium]|nr:class I SAM-dependent methyltransferase [Clostridiales bacterium]
MEQNDISSNLEQWNKLGRYSQWMYHIYMDYVGDYVLDIGAGVGNLTRFLVDRCRYVVATDIFDKQINMMNNRFKKYNNFKAINFNILEDNIETLSEYSFDTVICINVLEHLENDLEAILRMKKILPLHGKIIILVPAWSKLYFHMDKNVGHHRRYDNGDLRKLAIQSGMKIVKNNYFNFWGIIPYYLKGKFSKDKGGSFSSDLNETNSRIYNVATKILEPIEKIFPPKVGLSEIIILEKIKEQ